jgi:AcrR family transcriptional regulator
MDKSIGQGERPSTVGGGRGPASTATRERLMGAAAQLIAELGWGRVTTRAVAARAGLPHGAVSYHFHGKQELLVESALHAFAAALPADAFAALHSIGDLLALIRAEVGDPDAIDPVTSRLMLETMREAERDPLLRERMGTMMRDYRGLITDLVRGEQRRGVLPARVPAESLATLLGAAGDGLLLHALLDPDLDVGAALDALRELITPRTETRSAAPESEPEGTTVNPAR